MISLLIPFWSKDPERIKVFDWVSHRWGKLFPEWELNVGLSGEDFNRSAARNHAFAQSKGEIIVLADADVACNKTTMIDAIAAVEDGSPWIIAHHSYYSLTQQATQELLSHPVTEELEVPRGSSYDWVMRKRSIAGVLVMKRESFEAVGGYNEDFKGWGYEDDDFAVRMDREVGRHDRVPGLMLHLWHPRGDAHFQQPNIQHNMDLLEKTVRP